MSKKQTKVVFPLTFDRVLDVFLDFQRTTGESVCEVRMCKQIYTKVLKLGEGLFVEGTLYGATLIKDNTIPMGEMLVTGCEEWQNDSQTELPTAKSAGK